MKFADKFLLAIVAAIILLVIAAFAVVLLRPEPVYRTDESAEAVVYNYLLALQLQDYDRALELISTDVINRPQDASAMEWDIKQEKWQFERYGDPSLTISGSNATGDQATVSLIETRSNSPILGDVYSEEITMRLQLEEGGWKLIDGQAFWAYEWSREENQPINR